MKDISHNGNKCSLCRNLILFDSSVYLCEVGLYIRALDKLIVLPSLLCPMFCLNLYRLDVIAND